MNHIARLSLVVVIYCACAIRSESAQIVGADNKDAAMKEYAKFEGVWRFALVEVEGVKQPDAPFETNKLIISKDGGFTIVQGPKITQGTLKLDPTKTPKHYDFTVTEGPDKGLTALGIYELDGDTYKICLPLRNKERPAVLISKPGSGCLFQVFKREKQDVKEALIEVRRQQKELKK